MKRIVIAGGSGFLGQVLARHLSGKAWDVAILARPPILPTLEGRLLPWDGQTIGPWIKQLEGVDAIVNLCGESVNCRYNRRNRGRIVDSRIKPTTVLGKAILMLDRPPPVWLNASSATIYAHSLHTPHDEATGAAGDGFSVETCQSWERAFFEPKLPATRRVALRTSMVLGHGENSVLPALSQLARWGLGGRFGSGQQMVSWIHEKDFARAIEFTADDDSLSGPVNVTAPAPVRNRVFMSILRDAIGAPLAIPHPKLALKIGAWLMRTEPELVTKSRFALPAKLLRSRFVFRFPFVDDALADLISSHTNENLLPIHQR